jgi:hypothetical protein
VFTITTSSTFGIVKAANNEPRFDHDPVTLACRGLLIEEGRTNLISHSEDMTVANGWNTESGTLVFVNNADTSPSGSVTAEKLQEADTTTTRKITTKLAATVIGTTYTLSVYAKASERSILQIATSVGFTTVTQNFDLVNGVLGTGGATAPSIVDAGNGWYRCSIQAVSSASGNSLFAFGIVPASNSGRFASYTGVVGNGIFLWGAQLEVGSFATSYIPTTTGSVVRSADVCSITGGNFSGFYNQPEGTLFADVTPQTVDQGAVVIGVNTTTFFEANIIYKTNSSVAAPGRRWAGQTYAAISVQAQIATSTDVAVSRSRLAYAYKLNDFAFAASGSLVGTDTSGTVPSPTAMRIGARDDGLQINGHIAAVRYYKKRLPDAKLAQLTV